MEKISKALSKQASALKWLNLGGGYLFSQIEDKGAFVQLVKALKGDFALDVYIEPGKDIVGRAGYLCTRVIDRFDSDGKTVLIVDSTVNHHPEIFEYQRAAELLNPQQGEVPVILAGSSCLAGDLFGEYRFDKTPEIGERIVFKNLGAYSLIKANRFNGYNLPTIYNWDGKNLMQLKQDDYQDYRKQWRVGG
nr:hypothetical protein [Methylomarinum sp. Ch1-1]MDP4519479.1 hypothetical protein [Methylomarinum sp. Ch1-1]